MASTILVRRGTVLDDELGPGTKRALLGGLPFYVPWGEEAADLMAQTPYDVTHRAVVTRPTNPRFRRKAFMLCQIVADNYPVDRTARQIMAMYQRFAGIGESFTEPDGSKVFIPQSVAWESMDDTKFGELYDGMVSWVCERVIVGLTEFGLNKEVEERLRGFHGPAT